MTDGYVNGSDLLLSVGGKAVGHCTSHTMTFNSETKDRAVKPVATQGKQAALWKQKGVNGLSISVSAEGLRFYNDTENGFTQLSALWGVGDTVEVKGFERTKDTTPYLVGKFIITSMEETAPANDDATYKIDLEAAGEPDVYPGKTSAVASVAHQ